MRHRRTIAALTLGITLLLTVFTATPASAASPGEFVGKVNELRESKGLGTLSVDSRLSGQAQQWAEKMADVNAISHNPNLSGTPGNWTKVGENVGTGGTVTAIFDALVASPGHYRNMVDASFNSIGVGVAMGSDGRIYTCHVFAAFPGKPAVQSSPSAPAVAPAAPAVAPTVKAVTPTTVKAKSVVTKTQTPAKVVAPKPTTTTTVPPTTTTTAVPVTAPVVPVVTTTESVPATPSQQIVSGLAEVGSLATQG